MFWLSSYLFGVQDFPINVDLYILYSLYSCRSYLSSGAAVGERCQQVVAVRDNLLVQMRQLIFAKMSACELGTEPS